MEAALETASSIADDIDIQPRHRIETDFDGSEAVDGNLDTGLAGCADIEKRFLLRSSR